MGAQNHETRGAGKESAAGKDPLWLFPNLLSLDAPVVAVVWQWLFGKAYGVEIPGVIHWILGGAVWMIYVADRILDGVRMDSEGPWTPRHRFARRNWKILLTVWFCVGTGVLFAVLSRLPMALVARGIFLGMLVIVYFVYVGLARRFRVAPVPKEMFCGILFGLGTALAPTFYSSTLGGLELSGWGGVLKEGFLGVAETIRVAPLLFGALCALNCVGIAAWEWEADRRQDPAAVTRGVGREGRGPLDASYAAALVLLMVAGLVLSLWRWGVAESAIYQCVAVSAAGLWFLHRRERALSRSALRTLADVVLLTPLPLMPFL